MAYTARITTQCPSAFFIMVDQSGSMAEPVMWNGQNIRKSEAVAQVINSILAEIIARTKGDDSYRHYFDIAVIGYGVDGVNSLLPTGESWFMTPAQLAGSVRRTVELQRERLLPDGRKIQTKTNLKIWVEPQAGGTTPMFAALNKVYEQLRLWGIYKDNRAHCFPPVVINITDGEATDANADSIVRAAEKVKSVCTGDGNTLLINIHIGGNSHRGVVFPVSEDSLSEDRYAHLLYRISSVMPEIYTAQICDLLDLDGGFEGEFRGMGYNASIADLLSLMNIGSTTLI